MANTVNPANSIGTEASATEALQASINEIRARILDVLLEADYILLQENPRIEADYAVKIGYLENELLRVQIEARRARRKAELAQARVNSGSGIDEASIEEGLDEEFAEWQEQLEGKMEFLVQMMEQHVSREYLPPEKAREVKELHRTLVKRLHPDLVGDDDPDRMRFLLITEAAYKAGDFETLRAIESASRHMEPTPQELSDVDELNAERALLEAQLSITEDRLNSIKEQNPYALKEKLADPEWLCTKVAELKSEISKQEAARDAYKERFEQLKGVSGNGCDDGC